MPRQRAGFTLIELMIAISIMGALIAMVAPGIGEFLSDARAASAAEDLVRLSRHMRARAQETGLAHMLVFNGTGTESGGLGIMRVYEGMNNHCRQTPWSQTITGRDDDGHAPVEVLDMATGAYNPTSGSSPTIDDRDRNVIVLRVAGAASAPDGAILCVEPGGSVWDGVASTVLGAGYIFIKPASSKPILFTISRTMNSAVRGRDRSVMFSTSGLARFKF
jgi:prepilin-type N-terminal cleavage/methylation domain-containing protein